MAEGGPGPYGRLIAEHFRRPRNQGPLPGATASAEAVNPLCGDRIRLAVVVSGDGATIVDARFVANACAICVAAASLLTEHVRGMSPNDAARLRDEAVLALVGAVPAGRRRCATLPLEALRRAVGGTTVAVLLAAGSARRFDGTQKLLVPVSRPGMHETEGEPMPLVRLSLLGLREGGVERVVVVLGRDAERVRECLVDLGPEFVVNTEHASGMSSSLRAGVEAAMRHWPDSAGLLVALGDQPLAGSTVVERLVRQFETVAGVGASPESRIRIVAPRYRGEQGTPVLFARELVTELLALGGDRGARSVVERAPERVQYVDFDRAAPVDVDTPADLSALIAESRYS